ncbi:Protein ALWAYS EARLY 3 [Forsythia ovata]|uniref:Protein ALWAYS EARLY 3 n=1 Tax=Forsythia ovata TaxID=205694 RepID=A0ABD1P6Y5_9LAMI
MKKLIMGPTRKYRSVNKQYINEPSPSKDGDSAKRSNSRKRKLSDALGPQWGKEDLSCFYEAYRKYGKDWEKVAGAVRNRSVKMVEALYTMNRAYLSLPEGTASVIGLIAMMTDHYISLAGSDSEQESDDGAESSRKPQKRARGKDQPTNSKTSDRQLIPHSQIVASDSGCLLLLKKKCSGGSRSRPVGKRTPRFPVSYSYENMNRENYFSPPSQRLKIEANANDADIAHEIAIALAEASQKRGSPQVSGTPCRRAEIFMPSPVRHAQIKSVAEMVNVKLLATDTDGEDSKGSMEADAGELCGKLDMMESVSGVTARGKGRKLEGKKFEVDKNSENHLVDIKQECNGMDEGQRLGAMRANVDVEIRDAKISRSCLPSQRKKSKKVPSRRDEGPAFDALQTLADMSLMMPTENEDESKVQSKYKDGDHVDKSGTLEALPANQQKIKRRPMGFRVKGYQPISSSEVASSKTSKPGKVSLFDVSIAREESEDPHLSVLETRKKQKIRKTEACPEIHLSESPGIEAGDAGKKLMSKNKKASRSGSQKLMKSSNNPSSADLQRVGSDSAQSAIEVPVVYHVDLPTEVGSTQKMGTRKPQDQKDSISPDKVSNNQTNKPSASFEDQGFNVKNKISSCLSNHRLRRWCKYEWFYSAIDYPWYAKREFVEYLYHVGLGHVPRLTLVEWGVIRSSLGKPRRFSEQFLKEEKEKLNQYRDSVRRHYTELREGIRGGIPTDLVMPLSVGQHIIAIHPKTREIHDGCVLTVEHSRCRVQFDRHELGVEFVRDVDCMPLTLFKNMHAWLGRQTDSVDMFFGSSNELKMNGRAKEFMKISLGDNLDNIDSLSHLSPSAHPASSLLKQTKVASADANLQTRIWPAETATYQQTVYSLPSSLAQIQSKEADVQALAELTHALDKKEAVVLELRRMNNEVLETQKNGDSSLKESKPFKRQYAAVCTELNGANDQVSSALYCLRQRNTYQVNSSLTLPRLFTNFGDPGDVLSCFDTSACQPDESGSHMNEIINSSRTKALTMVDAALQAMPSFKGGENIKKIEEAIDYVNSRISLDGSCMSVAPDPKLTDASDKNEAQIPSELITKCVATLLMIQKCTERRFPPDNVAQILDFAVKSLQPSCLENLPVYAEIQKCMGIIRSQILALIPT